MEAGFQQSYLRHGGSHSTENQSNAELVVASFLQQQQVSLNGKMSPDPKQQPQLALEDRTGGSVGKARLKPAAACKACRSRKHRCDGGKPACQSCIKRNVRCVYIAAKPKLQISQDVWESILQRNRQLEEQLKNG